MKTYQQYTYLYPVENQADYHQINQLLASTSKEANELRSIYDGVVLSFQRWGYNEEDAQKMAGYYMGSMMTVHGVVGAGITLPRIQKVFGNTKQLIGKTATNAGKGTAANKPLDKTDLELQHGKGNVEQGGGNYKETKDKILDNQAANQKANESSKFGEHVAKEQQINAGKGMSSATGQTANNLNINELVNSANKPVNAQGLSEAARAWEKHAGRQGGTFDPLKGNVTQKNAAASEFVKGVLENPNTIRTELSRGGVEYRLPNGQGIRYNADGSFSGFLDPKKK